jgi:predicted dehydrogenase
MVNIGITAACRFEGNKGCYHGNAFCSMFNGWDQAKAEELDWQSGGAGDLRLEGGRVVKIYDDSREQAEIMQQVYGIDEVVASPAELAEGVDAVIVADSGEFDKWKLGIPAIEKGLPIFIDKPLAETADEAQAIVDMADAAGASLFSCSGFRWCDGAEAARQALPGLGELSLMVGVSGQGQYHVYGIHPTEMVYGILGPGTVSVVNVGEEDRDILRLKRRDGVQVVLTMLWREVAAGGQQYTICGSQGWHQITDLGPVYLNMLGAFLEMCKTRVQPISNEEMVEVIRVVEAGRISRERGGEEVCIG